MGITRSFLALSLAAGFVVTASGATRAAPTTWEDDLLNVQVLAPNPQTVFFDGTYNVTSADIRLFADPNPVLSIGPTSVSFRNTSSSEAGIVPYSTMIKITDLTARRIESVQIDPVSNVNSTSS